jgi:enterochelin esterase-like enzyme
LRALLALLAVLLVLAGCGGSDSTGTAAEQVQANLRIGELTIDSRAVGSELPVSVVVPASEPMGERPLLVFLHGAGGSNESFIGDSRFLAAVARLGDEAPIIAFPYGEESWWHKRASGDWETYVVREVIPAVSRRFGGDPDRVAIGGVSMGGFGAYHLGLAYPNRFCAIGGHSAGLWPSAAEEFPGAFDDQTDYEEDAVLPTVEADPEAFGDTPIWNDYGNEDWFVTGNAAFVASLERGNADLTAHVWPGGHEVAYWYAHYPAYLRFYADELADC